MAFWHRGTGRAIEGRGVGRGSVIAALMSVLLASCSTASDPTVQLGLAPAGDQSASTTLASASLGEDTLSFADASAPTPTARPGQEDAAAVAAAEETPQAPDEAQGATKTAQAEPEAATAETNQETASAAPATPQSKEEVAVQAAAAELPAEAPPQNAEETSPKKRDFLSAFFSGRQSNAAAAVEKAAAPVAQPKPAQREEKPKVVLTAATSDARPVRASLGDALPGVRQGESLFEFTRKSGSGDADVDLYEDEPSYQVASAAGLARLAPNGLLKQRESVDTACLKPALVSVLKKIERHYGKRIIVTSGYRSPSYNQRVRGARNSLHMYCAAADIQIDGVSKWELAKFARSMPGRGGVGTYCHTNSVHVDVGPERDWNWRCRRRK